MGNSLNSDNLFIAQKSLDALWLRQKVISNNIANADTPGYKSQSVAFEDILSNALEMGLSQGESLEKSLSSLEPEIRENNSTQVREDGTNVDIDKENIELTRTQLQYETMVRLIAADIDRKKYAITGGR